MKKEARVPEFDIFSTRNYRPLGEKYLWREDFRKCPTWDERIYMQSYAFNGCGIKALFAKDNPADFALWDSILRKEHWLLMGYAVSLRNTDVSGKNWVSYNETTLRKSAATEFFDWAEDLSFLVNTVCWKLDCGHFSFEQDKNDRYQYFFRVQNLVIWLYESDRVVRYVEKYQKLRGEDFSMEFLLRNNCDEETATVILGFYERARPAADLWRNLPWSLLSRYEQLGGARTVLNKVDKQVVRYLQREITERGYLMDDNAGRRQAIVSNWWDEWTEHDYSVDCVPHSFDCERAVQVAKTRLEKACDAFDPNNPVNAKVLKILSKPDNRPDSRNDPIIKNQGEVFANLCKMRDFMQKAVVASQIARKPQMRPSWTV
jgi:hypothetical protein